MITVIGSVESKNECCPDEPNLSDQCQILFLSEPSCLDEQTNERIQSQNNNQHQNAWQINNFAQTDHCTDCHGDDKGGEKAEE